MFIIKNKLGILRIKFQSWNKKIEFIFVKILELQNDYKKKFRKKNSKNFSKDK